MYKTLQMAFYPQLTSYSCGAAVFQAAVHFLLNEKLSHKKSIQITGARPNGVHMSRLKKELRAFGIVCGTVKRRQTAYKTALDEGKLIVLDDNNTYKTPHVVLLYDYGPKNFLIMDPMMPLLRRLSGPEMMRTSSDEAFTIYVT